MFRLSSIALLLALIPLIIFACDGRGFYDDDSGDDDDSAASGDPVPFTMLACGG